MTQKYKLFQPGNFLGDDKAVPEVSEQTLRFAVDRSDFTDLPDLQSDMSVQCVCHGSPDDLQQVFMYADGVMRFSGKEKGRLLPLLAGVSPAPLFTRVLLPPRKGSVLQFTVETVVLDSVELEEEARFFLTRLIQYEAALRQSVLRIADKAERAEHYRQYIRFVDYEGESEEVH